ncbi:MAG: multidrug transporter subunit MdtA, partial [Burkholderia sp.]|nr:multidrug transporter subunit MdtA [Burkholderia sp.]
MDNEQKPTPPSKDPASPAARRPRRTLMIGTIAVVVIGGLLWWHPWNRTPAAGSTAQSAGASAAGAKRGRGGPAAM